MESRISMDLVSRTTGRSPKELELILLSIDCSDIRNENGTRTVPISCLYELGLYFRGVIKNPPTDRNSRCLPNKTLAYGYG